MEIELFASPVRICRNAKQARSPLAKSSGKKSNFHEKHRQMYKTPPRWLKNYRDKCISELSSRRQERQARLIDNFRKINLHGDDECRDDESKDKIIREVMKSVWKETVEPQLGLYDEDDYQHHFLMQLELELFEDEENYWNNYMESMDQMDQDEIEWAVENQHSLVCFFCQKHPLSFHHSPVNGGQNSVTEIRCDNCKFIKVIRYMLTPDQLDTELTRLMNEHQNRFCLETIKFELVSNTLGQASTSDPASVYIFCPKCNFSNCLF